MKLALAVSLILFSVHTPLAGSQTSPDLMGRWKVNFSLVETTDKNLILDVKAKGNGSFLLLDTGLDNQPVPEPQPAIWSEISGGRVTFSANVEMPLGTCCREVGTLIFKGTYVSHNLIKGRTIFITSITDDENFVGYRSSAGVFTATREP